MFSDAPRSLPAFSFLYDELGNPAPAKLARHLDVSVRTVLRWIKADHAPRTALLAMFWETRYGRSAVECRAVNDAVMQAELARCHRDEARQRLRELEHVLSVGDFGSANSPLANEEAGTRPALDLQMVRTEAETTRQRVKRSAARG